MSTDEARIDNDEPWDDEDWEHEGADDADDLIGCPECREPIYADVEQCPVCGHWILDQQRRAAEGGLWSQRYVRMVAIIALIAFAGSIVLSIVR